MAKSALKHAGHLEQKLDPAARFQRLGRRGPATAHFEKEPRGCDADQGHQRDLHHDFDHLEVAVDKAGLVHHFESEHHADDRADERAEQQEAAFGSVAAIA